MSNGQGNGEEVEILHDDNPQWRPVVGEEAAELLGHLNIDGPGRNIVRDEAIAVLSHGIPPVARSGQQTGLVVGYVQSGKTLSFTTVAALARDNGYPLVIVIAGTSVSLTTQSQRRLRGDLRLDTRADRLWRHLHNPDVENRDHIRIDDMLADWRDPSVNPVHRATVLITVMKHHGRLRNLIDVLSRIDLGHIPVLIIDDEADQAGLNNLINQGEESTTYHYLRQLKSIIPHHTFLQYTATPQGPLLINLIDVLSPGFAVTLTPGPGYVGGRAFFLEHPELVREIPNQEIPTRDNPLHEPPDSLLEALRIYFLGVASGWIRDNGRGNRSMMVHPSQRTVGHQQYFDWITEIRHSWLRILANPTDPDYAELVDDFRSAYDNLRDTVEGFEAFDELVHNLARSIRLTDVHLVNAAEGPTPQIDWRGAYSHILVGGQALDRGYTVEGLTVTYMPRGVGARRADTIQQRARFCGYKQPYLGYCRVYLEPDVSGAFTRYVAHEEDIRNRLQEYAGRPLQELRRAFLLPRGLSATRDSIIDVDYVRARVSGGWFNPRAPHDSPEAIRDNSMVIQDYLDATDFVDDEGHPDRTLYQRHQLASGMSLREVYENMLLNLRFTNLSDAQNFLGIMIIIRQALVSDPEERCTVYYMSGGESRERTLNENGEIPTLFQGAAPVNPPDRRGEIYPGDREIRVEDGITIQIHMLDLRTERGGSVVYSRVPNIAVHIPERLANDVLIQDQGGVEETADE